MTRRPDYFRDYGLIPFGISAPAAETVRCQLTWLQIIGQFMNGGAVLVPAIAMSAMTGLLASFPLNLLAVPVLVFGGYLLYLLERSSFAWVEIRGDILRAKYFYTRRVVERSVAEIDHLFTLVYEMRTLERRTAGSRLGRVRYEMRRLERRIVESWLGRVRGVEIRFRDGRTPFRIYRTDPAMKNAKEFFKAVIYRMSQKGELDAEIIQYVGKPLVRRIYWDSTPQRGAAGALSGS